MTMIWALGSIQLSDYSEGRSYLTVPYRQIRNYMTVPYRQIRNYLTVLYRQITGASWKCYLTVPQKMTKFKIIKILTGHDRPLIAATPVREFCWKLHYSWCPRHWSGHCDQDNKLGIMIKTMICLLWSWKLSGHNDNERQIYDHWKHDLDTLETDN
jgi:hypothetical protein